MGRKKLFYQLKKKKKRDKTAVGKPLCFSREQMMVT